MRSPSRLLALALLVGLALGACSGSDDGDAPTAAAQPPATAAPTGVPTTAAVGGTLASDGICQVTIPDDWSDDGTARGRTSTNARWTLFGNRLADEAEWQAAVTLLKDQQGSRPGATVDERSDRVTVTQAEGRAIVVRQRFDDRYCELGVTAAGAVTPEVAAVWTSVAGTLAPVPQ